MDTISQNWITTAEAARIVGCSAGYMRRLIRQKAVSAHRLSSRIQLVDKKSLSRFSKGNKGFWAPGLDYPKK